MLDAHELTLAIAELEAREASLSTCSKLADLYTVLDHLRPAGRSVEPVRASPVEYGDSDFLKAVSKKDASGAWSVMDELMDTLRVVNPRVYDSVMRRIDRL